MTVNRKTMLIGLLLTGFFLAVPAFMPHGKAADPKAALAPVTFSTQDDHKNMMEQLGITKLRPGRNGNGSAPDHANYDEALANPHPDLPPVLTLKNGERVSTPEAWWNQRRP